MIQNGRKIFQMIVRYNNIFHSKALLILAKLGFLVWKKHLATLSQTGPWTHFSLTNEAGFRIVENGFPVLISFSFSLFKNVLRHVFLRYVFYKTCIFLKYIYVRNDNASFKFWQQHYNVSRPKHLTPWRDSNPGSYVLEVDAMTTLPRHQGLNW
jgi:hypothetical protein